MKLMETERLDEYNRALQGHTLWDQLEKMSGVKSPETLKRFLSAEAPDDLVSRYSFRVREVMEEMSDYEMGRVLFMKGDLEVAEVHLQKAVEQEGDNRGCYLLGVIKYNRGHFGAAFSLFDRAIACGINKEESLIYKGLYLLEVRKEAVRAREFFRGIINGLSAAKVNFVAGVIRQIDGEPDAARSEWVDGLERGDVFCGVELLNMFESEGNMTNLCIVLSRLIRLGYLSRYIQLGEVHENLGQFDLAEECFMSAVKAGIMRGYESLAKMNIRRKKVEDAVAYAKDAVANGFKEVYVPLVNLLIESGRYTEAVLHLNEMFAGESAEYADQMMSFISRNPAQFNAMSRAMVDCLTKGDHEIDGRLVMKLLGKESAVLPSGQRKVLN